MTRRKTVSGLLLCLIMALCMLNAAGAESGQTQESFLRVENGILQPVLEYTSIRSAGFDNAVSENLAFCVYVETDHDTDNDGMADLVKEFVQVPRAAVEGRYRAGVIYDPTPYAAGTVAEAEESSRMFRTDVPFDYEILYQPGQKREPVRKHPPWKRL